MFAFALTGPYVGGAVVQAFGFPTTMFAVGTLLIVYSPLMFFLRRPPSRTPTADEEKAVCP